jgi:cell division protein FtsQ
MKRKNKTSLINKILKALPLFVGVTAVIYLGVLIKDIDIPTVLPVSDVQVMGELHFIDKNEIELLVKENISGGYFTVNLAGIRELLMQKPWVKNVSLRRKWPASVTIFIEEQVPVAYWNKNAFLSEKGNVFKPTDIDKRLNLPGLNGPQGLHHDVWQFMNVLYRETALLDYEVVRLTLDERRAWQLEIVEQNETGGNQINVRLGRFDTEKRLQRFVRVLPSLSTVYSSVSVDGSMINKIKIIDMRYPNGFAIKMDAKHIMEVKHSQNLSLANHYKNNNNSRYFVCLKNIETTQRCEA